MRPVLVLNPRRDRQFVRRARELLDDVQDAQQLADRLRPSYPDVVVRPRGLSAEPMTIWYVYRDGHWISDREAIQTQEDDDVGGRGPA